MASGEAEAIMLKAQATAKGIDAVAQAIEQGQGAAQNAISLQVAEKYVDAFGNLAKEGTSVIIPGNVGDIGGMIASAMAVYGKVNESSKTTASKLLSTSSQDSGAGKKIKELESRLNQAEEGTGNVQDEINKAMDQRLKR